MVSTAFHPRVPVLAAVLAIGSGLLLWGCKTTPPPGLGEPVAWSELEGWYEDRQAESWTALLRSCSKVGSRPEWSQLCTAAADLSDPDDGEARNFYERWFVPHALYAEDGERSGLITGYYEPLLAGSLERSNRYRFPIYERPADLISVDLAEVYPELRGKRVRGRLEGGKVVPYHSRASLELNPELLQGQELAWVDDPVALFFLHVQGSGRVQLPDGTVLGVGYADQNGHPYHSIGRELITMGELNREEVNLFSIRRWLSRNPARADALLRRNPSFVFFSRREAASEGPYGTLNVPLVAERSIAVDPEVVSLGSPVWLDTTLPEGGAPYRRLLLAQDTGGAIRGHVRADVFWGHGAGAERMAGLMKQAGRLYVFIPRPADEQAAY